MRAALAVLVLVAGLMPAAAYTARERALIERSAWRRFVELYDYRPTMTVRRPQRSGGCTYTSRGRSCWSRIDY